jgi:hypothetical protein
MKIESTSILDVQKSLDQLSEMSKKLFAIVSTTMVDLQDNMLHNFKFTGYYSIGHQLPVYQGDNVQIYFDLIFDPLKSLFKEASSQKTKKEIDKIVIEYNNILNSNLIKYSGYNIFRKVYRERGKLSINIRLGIKEEG